MPIPQGTIGYSVMASKSGQTGVISPVISSDSSIYQGPLKDSDAFDYSRGNALCIMSCLLEN